MFGNTGGIVVCISSASLSGCRTSRSTFIAYGSAMVSIINSAAAFSAAAPSCRKKFHCHLHNLLCLLKHTDQKIAIRTASDRDGVLCNHVLLAEVLSNVPLPMPSVSLLHRSQVSHTDAAQDVACDNSLFHPQRYFSWDSHSFLYFCLGPRSTSGGLIEGNRIHLSVLIEGVAARFCLELVHVHGHCNLTLHEIHKI